MPATYLLQAGISCSLGEHLMGLGETCLLICDRHPSDAFIDRMVAGILDGGGISSVEIMRIERPRCSKARARELAETIAATGADLVVAFGAAKILDLTRAALRCLQPERPSLALVTSVVASNASVGSLAVMYDDDGLPNGFWKLDRPPELVAVDPLLVLDASPHLLAFAMGDQLASSLEAVDGAGDASMRTPGVEAHEQAIETIFSSGAAALGELSSGELGPELLAVLESVTYYTPEQDAAASARLCHVLGAALSADSRTSGHAHGETVAACIPAELVLSGRAGDVPRWVGLLNELGLPVGLSGLGLGAADRDDIAHLVEIGASCPLGEGSVVASDRETAIAAIIRSEELIRSLSRA